MPLCDHIFRKLNRKLMLDTLCLKSLVNLVMFCRNTRYRHVFLFTKVSSSQYKFK
jgi:hypothetical protein